MENRGCNNALKRADGDAGCQRKYGWPPTYRGSILAHGLTLSEGGTDRITALPYCNHLIVLCHRIGISIAEEVVGNGFTKESLMKKRDDVCSGAVLGALAILMILSAGPQKGHAQTTAQQKVTICHVPPGNPSKAHTLTLPQAAVRAHLDHGDTLGPCGAASPHASTPTQGGGHKSGGGKDTDKEKDKQQ